MNEKQELADAELCPCESGKQYRRCCKKKDFKWVRDAQGAIYRVVPMHPELRKILEEQREKFIKIYEREPGPEDSVMLEEHSPEEVQAAMIEIMLESRISPEKIYVYAKTGLIVTEFNKNLIPENDLNEWKNAQKEFRKVSKKPSPPQKSERFLSTLEPIMHF